MEKRNLKAKNSNKTNTTKQSPLKSEKTKRKFSEDVNLSKLNLNFKHIIVPEKEKLLFLYTFTKRFSDKKILVVVSTNEIVKVSTFYFLN